MQPLWNRNPAALCIVSKSVGQVIVDWVPCWSGLGGPTRSVATVEKTDKWLEPHTRRAGVDSSASRPTVPMATTPLPVHDSVVSSHQVQATAECVALVSICSSCASVLVMVNWMASLRPCTGTRDPVVWWRWWRWGWSGVVIQPTPATGAAGHCTSYHLRAAH